MLGPHRCAHVFFSVVIAFLTPSIQAQSQPAPGARASGGMIVGASASADQVRFTALSLARSIRLEVVTSSGATVYDSGLQGGNRLAWQMQGEDGRSLADGSYGCLVTVEDVDGRMAHRRGVLHIRDGIASLRQSAANATGVADAAVESEDFLILQAETPAPFTLVSHDGKEGWVESLSGALSLYAGSNSPDPGSIPHFRLTTEGNVGIGVREPEAKLDVAGVIKAAEGFQFSDGTVLRTENGSLVLLAPQSGGTGGSPAGASGRKTRVLTPGGIGRVYAATTSRDPGWVLASEGGSPYYNTLYGSGAGGALTTGEYNSFFGANAGSLTTTGQYNTASGSYALASNTNGMRNTAIGTAALHDNTTGNYNTAIGTAALYSNTQGSRNTAIGVEALNDNTTGYSNTASGYQALNSNTTGEWNTASGTEALYTNTTGYSNTASGWQALNSNTTGSHNTAIGSNALASNTTGQWNTAIGTAALGNTTGDFNTASGGFALGLNTTGDFNTASGYQALYSNKVSYNTASGYQALYSNTTGANNTASGYQALRYNTTGGSNTASGTEALYTNITGKYNTASGYQALYTNTQGSSNTASGYQALFYNTTGTFNTASGDNALGSNGIGNYNTAIGYQALFSNSQENYNTALGSYSNGAANITNATAIGSRAMVTRSNSLVLGSINGLNGATADTNVGIGVSDPDRQLVVEGSQALARFRRYNDTGSSFGPALLFERGRSTRETPADIQTGDHLGKVQFRGVVGRNLIEYGAFSFIAADTSQNGRFAFLDRDIATERMSILNTGNVGIGTSTPTERLEIVGNLKLSGSILSSAWEPVPDYVFEPDYPLMPIGQLGEFVSSERHLPNIPSATEIKEKGLNVAEFQMKLLEKIEELTLYSIQQARIISAQGAQLQRNEEVIATISKRLDELQRLGKEK